MTNPINLLIHPSKTSSTYDCQIAHDTEIKFINNRYVTPVTVEFGNSDSDNSEYLHVKHRKYLPRSNSSSHLFPSHSMILPSIITESYQWVRHTQKLLMLLSTRNNDSPEFFVLYEIHSKKLSLSFKTR